MSVLFSCFSCITRPMHRVQICGPLLPMFHDLYFCLLGITMSCAKMAKPTEMLFRLWTQVGPGNHVLCGGLDSHMGRGSF